MGRNLDKSLFRRSFYLIFFGLIVVLLAFEVVVSRQPFAVKRAENLNNRQTKQLETYVEMNKLLTTLATFTIGATIGFVVNRDKRIKLRPSQLRRAIASWTLGGISLYFGYLSYRQVVWILDKELFGLYSPLVWWLTRAQFWTFLLSVAVLADFIYRTVGSEAQDQTAGKESQV